jgi:hypothetical protein
MRQDFELLLKNYKGELSTLHEFLLYPEKYDRNSVGLSIEIIKKVVGHIQGILDKSDRGDVWKQ